MKIRNKLNLLFTTLTATILLLFAALVYYSAYHSRETEFYKSLKKEAFTKANLFFNAKVNAKTLQTIYKNNRATLNEVEVAIYNTDYRLLYHDAVDIDLVKENPAMFLKIKTEKEIGFYQKKWQVIGLIYPFEGHNYLITAAAYDQYGYAKLKNLQQTIFIIFTGAIAVIFAAGYFFAGKALAPVSEMVRKVNTITATNLDLRLSEHNGKDELAELARTFNKMLDRLEKTFLAQKEFVSNIAHELRTPLTAMLAELQLTLEKLSSPLEYQQSIQHAIKDSRKVVRLLHSLLDLAKASYDQTAISYKKLRLDELLLDATNEVLQHQPYFKIHLSFAEEIENDDFISVTGNEYLLKLAFINLLDNGCKFSPKREVTVTISYTKSKTILQFQDEGIGIQEADLARLFTPFYRGGNKDFAEGQGIGLSLTQKIVQLHQGELNVATKPGAGSTFTLILKHL